MLRILLLSVMCLVTACSSTSFNPTTAHYEINSELLAQKPPKKLIIATANISGQPTLYYLQKAAARVDELTKTYLQQHGYQIAPSYLFENAWNQAIRTYGDMYDPTTGKVDPTTYRAVMIATAKTLHDTTDIDAIIFTDVIEVDISHSVGMDHLAQWDGVSRKPSMSTAGAEGVPTTFNWSQTIKGATLAVTIYSTNLEGLFSSRGGLDTLQAIDTKNDAIFVRRKHILDSDDNIEEGIKLAFHPFIKMKGYPSEQKK